MRGFHATIMFNAIRNFVVVSVITLMIWVYAEGENVKPHTLDVDIRFVPRRENLILQPEQVSRARITVRSTADKFAQLEGRTRHDTLDVPLGPGDRQPVDLKDRLTRNPIFAELGVNIVDVQPSSVTVSVQRAERVVLPVRVVAEGVELAAGPKVEPAEIELLVPADVARTIDDAALEARIDPERIARLAVNLPHTLTVDLTPPEPLRGAVSAESLRPVRVTLTVLSQAGTLSLPTVPVWISSPPSALGVFDVELDEDARFIRDVTLTGPADAIERIRRGETKVYAELRLSHDDLERAVGKESNTGQVAFTLPAGVSASPTPPPVTFRVTRRP